MKELLGALVAVVSAVLYVAGYVMEKRALVSLPEVKANPVHLVRVVGRNRLWVAGFLAMLVGLALQVGALTLAPVSVVQPILAGGLIALAAAGSSLLGERLSRRQITALVLVLVAVLAVGVSARGGDALARRVPALRFTTMALIVACLAVAAARIGLRRPQAGAAGRWERGLVGAALAAGLLYGLGAVAEKAVSTRLVDKGLVSGSFSSLATPYPWAFLVATLAGMMVFQVGLQAHPASLMASLTNLTSTVCALVGASVVFGEGLLPSGAGWVALRVLGFALVLVSLGLLAAGKDEIGAGGSTGDVDAERQLSAGREVA